MFPRGRCTEALCSRDDLGCISFWPKLGHVQESSRGMGGSQRSAEGWHCEKEKRPPGEDAGSGANGGSGSKGPFREVEARHDEKFSGEVVGRNAAQVP